MKTKEQRYNELYSSGLVDSIKSLYANKNVNISEDYYVLMADYIDSLNQVKDSMIINPTEIARSMPELVTNIQDADLGGIYGITNEQGIGIEQSLNYNEKKLYFFHELTHALQTSNINGQEQCAFYNGHDGMFLTEATTQYTAEMLYNISNGTNLNHREQPGTVRGISNRTPYSPLSEYQYNGDILELLSKSMDLPLPQVLSLAYKQNGRETLKGIYESMEGNQGKFDDLMNNLEQIYSIDNLLIHGYGQQLQTQTPLNITMQDGVTTFKGNLNTYRELMDKTERELVASYMENHNTEYILENYNDIAKYLTTPELKNNFLSAVQQLSHEMPQNNIINMEEYIRNREQHNETHTEMQQGYSINEYGEIIRPEANTNIRQNIEREQQTQMPDGYSINEYGEIIRPTQDTNQDINQGIKNTRFGAVIDHSRYTEQFTNQNQSELSFGQKITRAIAKAIQGNNYLMKVSFVEKFVNKQMNLLPPAEQEIKESNTIQSNPNTKREDFINKLTNFGQYRNLPPVQRMSDPQRLEEMRRKMEQNQMSTEDSERE